jgi:tetratricopeptide (TPR) repeat protein
MSATVCPECGAIATFAFFKKRGKYVCSECEAEFDEAPKPPIDPQTIFLSYAHKSEREEDFDVSEELVLLIKAELDKDGHTVWIDKEGIRSGSQWRERITSAILEHAHFLSFLSRRSVRDPGVCLNEIATALGSKRNIQTVLAGPEREVAAPLTISHLQWHDFQDWREIRAGTTTGPNGEEWDAWFAQRMALVREAVGSAQNARVSGQLQRLKDILVPSEFEARIIDKTKGFYGRQWLFDATQSWLDNSTSRMFWLKASPGIGKSAFAAKLTHHARSAVIGFFMCDFQGKKDPEESAREAICTLAFQMASRLPDYRVKLIYQQQVDKEKILKKSADDLFEYLITEPLNKSGKIPEATRLFLVIDGLDEAGRSDHGNALAELLVKHVNRLPEWLGVIVTSRPEPYLEQILKPLSGISVDGQTDQNRQDLVAWIGEKLPDQIIGEERQRIIDAVIDKSGGTFLYLRLIEEDKTLDISKPEILPDKLDGIFKQNFNRYFTDPQEYGNKTEPFLRLMVAAPGPLPAQMGRQILGWSQRDLTLKVIEPLGSLLQERDGGLVFFHASLSDWLKDPKRSGTHCVNDTGARELGEFVWSQFEDFDHSEWKQQVVQWLAVLMQHTDHWHEVKELNRAAEFLGEQLRHRDAISVRQRELERITQTLGADGVEAAECTQSLGTALKLIGDSTGALGQFRAEFAIRERLVTKDPNNAGLQRSLSVSCNGMGDILKVQGDLADAMAQYRKALAIRKRLASQDWDNTGWRRDLGLSYDRIGVILQAQGDLSGALEQFRKNLAISERLANQDPESSGWKRGLSVSHARIGDILKAQGDAVGALAEFRKSLAIRECLMTWDPENSGWQRDLSVGYNRIGDIIEAQGDLVGALVQFQKNMAIRRRLAAQDPDNSGWQRDLSVSYSRIGGILQAQGDLVGALAQFRKDLVISKRLATQDPDNSGWQRRLGVSYSRIGATLQAQGELAGALAELRKGSFLFQKQFDTGNSGALIDHAAGMSLIAGCRQAMGDQAVATALDFQVAEIDWMPSAIVGAFRKKSIPMIVARLDVVFDQCYPELQARIAKRCLGGLEAVGVADLATWRARAERAQMN